MRRWGLIGIATLALGCGDAALPDPCDGGACPAQKTVENVFQSTVDRMLDIIYVVDDTAAIAPYLSALPDGFAADANALAGMPGGVPDIHVAFIPASPCDAAPAPRAQTCGLTAPPPFLTDDSCGQQTNFTGTLADVFSCLGDFGEAACGPPQPLAALRRLLEQPPAGWEGFLRPGATLQIVIVSGQDDASPGAVSDTVDLVRSLKADPTNQIGISVVGASAAGDCTTFDEAGSPRLLAFAKSAGSSGFIDTICGGGIGQSLDGLFIVLADLAPECLSGIRDVDPETPGLQADCAVEDTIRRSDGSTTTTLLPSCDVAAPPCWSLQPSVFCPSGASFTIDRGAGFCPQWGTRTQVECLGCLDPTDPACAP